MSNKIREMSWTELRKRKESTDTVIIPTGSVEVYGPHMPMGTDGIVASEIAERIAERTGALVAPVIELGESMALASFPETFPMKRAILEDYLDDLFQMLLKYGFKNFLFITGHAGNVDTVSYLCKKYKEQHEEIHCGQIDWWRFTNANSGDIFQYQGYMAHGHASECGTSVMLYLRPELVHMEDAVRMDKDPGAKGFGDIIQYGRFGEKTPNGTIGDATVATAEKGKKIVERCVDKIVEFMKCEFV